MTHIATHPTWLALVRRPARPPHTSRHRLRICRAGVSIDLFEPVPADGPVPVPGPPRPR